MLVSSSEIEPADVVLRLCPQPLELYVVQSQFKGESKFIKERFYSSSK